MPSLHPEVPAKRRMSRAESLWKRYFRAGR